MFLFINLQTFKSHKDINWSCWIISNVNESTPFEWFKGILFENGRRYAKSDNTIHKDLKERIQNHILHVQFERKISVSQSNWHNMEYMYIITLNDRKCQNASKCLLRNGTEREKTSSHIHFRSLKCIRFVENNFVVANNGEGGGILDFVPFSGPGPSWLDQTGTMHN